jgi:hypothetical protein
MSLIESTKKLLKERTDQGTTLRQIVVESDGLIKRDWLYKFAQGDIENPGVNTIQSLHDYLKNLKPKSNS